MLRGPRGKAAPADNVVTGVFPDAVNIAEPDWLTPFPGDVWEDKSAELARAKWADVTAQMTRLGTLGPENATALEILCVNYARWKLAEAHVRQHGPIVPAKRTKVPQHNPYAEVARIAAAMVLKIENELGIPPSTRGRVAKTAKGPAKQRAADAWLARGGQPRSGNAVGG